MDDSVTSASPAISSPPQAELVMQAFRRLSPEARDAAGERAIRLYGEAVAFASACIIAVGAIGGWDLIVFVGNRLHA